MVESRLSRFEALTFQTLLSMPWALTNTVARAVLKGKGHRFNVPVISIGNIVAGGVGKTELAAKLAHYLISKGLRVVIAMRGYGAAKSWRAAFPNGGTVSNFLDGLALGFPDEALVLLRKVPGVILAVGGNRKQVLERNWGELSPDIILLDDGYQHFRIVRDLDILVHDFNVSTPLFRDFPMQFKKVGVRVSFSEIPQQWNSFLKEQKYPWIRSRYRIEGVYGADDKKRDLPQSAYAFCGIGNPVRFKNFLAKSGVRVLGFKTFRDHHLYTQKDLNLILDSFRKYQKIDPNVHLLTTLKDYVKLQKWTGFDPSFELSWVNIDLEFINGENLLWKAVNETLAISST